MGTKDAGTHAGAASTAMSVEKIKKILRIRTGPNAQQERRCVRFGIWTIPYNALAAKVAPRPRGGGTPGAVRVGFLHGSETAEPVLSL